MLVVLAHGALGPYDELIFAAVGIIFLAMMGISWVRSRHEPDDADDVLDAPPAASEASEQDAGRFRLQ
jgi:hypothetical protein